MTITKGGTVDAVLTDEYGFHVENTPMGESRTVSPVRLIGASFSNSSIDPNFWTAVTSAGALATQSDGMLSLFTGTSANGSATVTSVRTARYIGGSSNRWRGIVQLGDSGTANNIRRWGAFNDTNGAFFELNGTSLSVVTRKSSNDTSVPSASWDISTDVPDLTKSNSYEIYWTNNKVHFNAGELVHVVIAASAPWSQTMNLQARVQNTNVSGSTTNVALYCRAMTISRLGPLSTEATYYHTASAGTYNLKFGPGTLRSVNINGAGAVGAALTVYDNTSASGTVISIYDIAKIAGPTHMPYSDGVHFNLGLTIVQTGNFDSTIIYE